MSTEPETHTGKAGTEHGREHCRPRWCGEFPGEGHPLAATEEEKRMLAAGADPVDVYNGNGAYRTREEGERAIAGIEARRCPCGGIDWHRLDYPGAHWDRQRQEWRS
jgi:hypothetical protein